MKLMIQVLFIIPVLIFTISAETFLDQQRKTQRFRESEKEKIGLIKELFASKGVAFPHIELFIRIFKVEGKVELWAREANKERFILIRTYDVCSSSGELGPKRRQGDGQVPEGCYVIDRFNPYSAFYLSLGLNYPNPSDRILSTHKHLGGDIFIHGSCVTIGCVPITDYHIKELYVICVYAKNNGQATIPVHVFPLKMDKQGMRLLEKHFSGNRELLLFWDNLKEVYAEFENTHDEVRYRINKKGRYIVQ